MTEEISRIIASHGGAALLVDYGYADAGFGETLQAVRDHHFAPVLSDPGASDLSAHVDFAALAESVREHGLQPELTTQGEFLLGVGLLERAGSLGAAADESQQRAISDAVERLAAPDAMGTLFKVMKILPMMKPA